MLGNDGVRRNRIVGRQKYNHYGDAEQQRLLLLTSTAAFFGKLVLKNKEKTANSQPTPSPTTGESGKGDHDGNTTVLLSRPSLFLRDSNKKVTKESDGHYPQSWLIAYFALNALRVCFGGGADANPSIQEEKEDNNDVIAVAVKNVGRCRHWLELDNASADALVKALVSCCCRADGEKGREEGLAATPSLVTLSPSLSPPLWLQRGLGASAQSNYYYDRLSPAIGVSPDGSPSWPSPLGPTVTLTFCALQTLMNVTRKREDHGQKEKEEDQREDQSERNGNTTNPPIVSLLEEASMRVHFARLEEKEKGGKDAGLNMTLLGDDTTTTGSCTCTPAINENASLDGNNNNNISMSRCATTIGQRRGKRTHRKGLLAHQMALFAWHRLREFAQGLLRSSSGATDGDESGRSNVSSGISDPRDLYSALMTLWLVYREYAEAKDDNEDGMNKEHGAPAAEKGEEEELPVATAASPFHSAVDGITSVLEGFVRETWRGREDGGGLVGEGDGDGCDCRAMRAAITEWLIERCYVPHEGAFGSPVPPQPVVSAVPAVEYSKSLEDGNNPLPHSPLLEHQRAVEAHTGMTYCCVVSLVLLGYFSSAQNELGEDENFCGGEKHHPAAEEREGEEKEKKKKKKKRPHNNNDKDERKRPQSVAQGLKRYLYARQAHFGLSVSEYDAYEDSGASSENSTTSTAEEKDRETDPREREGEDHEEVSSAVRGGSRQRSIDVQTVDTGRTQQQTSAHNRKEEVAVGGDNDDEDHASFIVQEQRRLLVASSRFGSARRHQCPQEQTFRTCGFQGRPNKDSDTCYSFWALGSLRALAVAESKEEEEAEQRRREDVVDRFLADSPLSCSSTNVHSQKSTCPSLSIREDPRGSQSYPSIDLLHDEHSLHAFTLLTAGDDVPCSGCGCSGIEQTGAPRPYILAKDADAETTPDPLHSFLGLAGLSSDEGPYGSNAVFPFA